MNKKRVEYGKITSQTKPDLKTGVISISFTLPSNVLDDDEIGFEVEDGKITGVKHIHKSPVHIVEPLSAFSQDKEVQNE